MQYMILLFGSEEGWDEASAEDYAEELKKFDAFQAWADENDVNIVHAAELELSTAAHTVMKDGAETDGPFLEIKEQLGGYYMIETDNPELAKEAARRMPNFGANELRPRAVRD